MLQLGDTPLHAAGCISLESTFPSHQPPSCLGFSPYLSAEEAPLLPPRLRKAGLPRLLSRKPPLTHPRLAGRPQALLFAGYSHTCAVAGDQLPSW